LFHQTSWHSQSRPATNQVKSGVEMHELINDIFDISELILGIQDVLGITLEPILAKKFIFELDIVNVLHCIEFH
jgi:hypothetical protein